MSLAFIYCYQERQMLWKAASGLSTVILEACVEKLQFLAARLRRQANGALIGQTP